MVVFDCVCNYQTRDILRLAAVCGDNDVPLGVLMPAPQAGAAADPGLLHLRKRFSKSALAALGYTDADSFRLISPGEVSEAETGQGSRQEAAEEPICYVDWPDPPEIPEELEQEAAAASGLSPPADAPAPEPAFSLDNLDELTSRLGPILEQLLKPQEAPEQSAAPQKPEQSAAPQKPEQKPDEPPGIDGWAHISNPGVLFHDPGIAAACDGVTGALLTSTDGCELLAVPVSPDAPFPMMAVFCFGSPGEIGGRDYIIFKIADGNLTL
jgi:hypothetical protein